MADVKNSRLGPPPSKIMLPDGEYFSLWEPPRKKNNLVIVGNASLGKTSWIQHELRGTKYYYVSDEKNPWDQFDDHRVIVWDDPEDWPKKRDLCFFSNLGLPHSPGGTLSARYYPRVCMPGARCMFILCNQDFLAKCPYLNEGWFTERFDVKHVHESWECQDSDCDCE